MDVEIPPASSNICLERIEFKTNGMNSAASAFYSASELPQRAEEMKHFKYYNRLFQVNRQNQIWVALFNNVFLK